MKPSIASSARLMAYYFAVCVVGTLLCAFVYMVYSLCMTLVAGEGASFFSARLFVRGVLATFPLVLALSPLLLSFYLARHPTLLVLPVVTYVVLSLASWYVLMPIALDGTAVLARPQQQEESLPPLSAGLFRQDGADGSVVTYFSRVSQPGGATGLAFDTSLNRQQVYTFSDAPLAQSDGGFADSIIGGSVSMPGLMERLFSGYGDMLYVAQRTWAGGYLRWAFFASMGLALCSVLGLCGISKWRVLNVNAAMYATALILLLNYLYLCTTLFDGIAGGLGPWFMSDGTVQFPLLVALNLLVAAIFFVTGIIMFFRNRKEAILSNQGAA